MKKIASKGAIIRMKLHGNPGTPEGRRLGGMRSLKTHALRESNFKTLRKINKPRHSSRLAELLGIFMGDGHVHTYQATVCTNSETDIQHAFYIKHTLEELFSIPVSISYAKDRKACTVVASSREVCSFLNKHGMPIGNKLTKGLIIPSWIVENISYRRAFLRGLIDTDGCVYKDNHTIKGVIYSSTCIAFTSASPELRRFVTDSLIKENLWPTVSGRDVRLRRKKDVHSYAEIIGFSNPKHSQKIGVE
ncbi:hypothetical protein BH11PAT2_BH11PAT2_06200 [soil metagenome]